MRTNSRSLSRLERQHMRCRSSGVNIPGGSLADRIRRWRLRYIIGKPVSMSRESAGYTIVPHAFQTPLRISISISRGGLFRPRAFRHIEWVHCTRKRPSGGLIPLNAADATITPKSTANKAVKRLTYYNRIY